MTKIYSYSEASSNMDEVLEPSETIFIHEDQDKSILRCVVLPYDTWLTFTMSEKEYHALTEQ